MWGVRSTFLVRTKSSVHAYLRLRMTLNLVNVTAPPTIYTVVCTIPRGVDCTAPDLRRRPGRHSAAAYRSLYNPPLGFSIALQFTIARLDALANRPAFAHPDAVAAPLKLCQTRFAILLRSIESTQNRQSRLSNVHRLDRWQSQWSWGADEQIGSGTPFD